MQHIDVGYNTIRDEFLSLDDDERAKMLRSLSQEGHDDLVMDLLYEIDDTRERAYVSPYDKDECGYDEVVDLLTR